MGIKMQAGVELLAWLHGPKAALAAKDTFVAKHQTKTHTFDTVTLSVALGTTLPPIVKQLGFAESNAAASRKMVQGGVRVNGEKVVTPTTVLDAGEYRLEVGKRSGCHLVLTIAP